MAKVGQPRLFKDPSELEVLWEAYLADRENKTIDVYERGAREAIAVPKPHPISISDFCAEIGMARRTFYEYRQRKEYLHIITRISEFTNNFLNIHGMVGNFNPVMTSRYLDKWQEAYESNEEKKDDDNTITVNFAFNSSKPE